MENAICSFMIKFPNLLRNLDHNIQFQDADLDEFKNWIVELVEDHDDVDKDLITIK